MRRIAFCSVKGAPGVTTTAQAVAVAAAVAARAVGNDSEDKVLLVEADPFGGDLAARYGAQAPHSLARLFAAGRRGVTPELLWDHTESLPDGLRVLFGMGGPDQAVANEGAWPIIVGALDELSCDVVFDVGRLLPNFAGGVSAILGHLDTVVLVCSPTLDSMVHVRAALNALTTAVGAKRLVVIPTGEKGYGTAQIGSTLRLKVGTPLPFDPAGAAALFAGHSKKLAKSRLFKWATAMVVDLGLAVSAPPPATASQLTEPRPTAGRPAEPQLTEPRPTEPRPTEPRPTEPQLAASQLEPAAVNGTAAISRVERGGEAR